MFPYDEYLRTLKPESASNGDCYTYINKDICLALDMSEEDADEMVGWYLWNADFDWESEIPMKNKTYKIAPGTVLFDVSQSFLGQFAGGCDFHFVCNGQVICDTTEFQTGTAKYYLFHNWTPSNVNLTEIEVECVGGDGYMFPYDEYLRTLKPESASNGDCYTYINKDICLALDMSEEDADEMVGWYLWKADFDWESEIPMKNKTWKVGEKGGSVSDVVLTPGYAYLGQFAGGCNFHFKMPNPVRK